MELKISKIVDADMNLDVIGQEDHGCNGCEEVVQTKEGKPTGHDCHIVGWTGWVWGSAF